MTAEIHDMVAAGDKVAIRATYRGTDEGGFIPNMPATGKAFEMEAMYLVRANDAGQIAEHWGVVDTIGDGTARPTSASIVTASCHGDTQVLRLGPFRHGMPGLLFRNGPGRDAHVAVGEELHRSALVVGG
jgi:hypothetical protein